MSVKQHVQFAVNNEETLNLCNIFKCRENELGRVIKSTLLKKQSSQFYREPKELMVVVGERKVPFEDEIKDFSDKQLFKILGAKDSKDEERILKKIRAKGLHFGRNVNTYLMQFVNEWESDPYRLRELMLQMRHYMKLEFTSREIALRFE